MHNYPGHSVEEHGAESELPDSVLIRPAQLSDVPALLQVINEYASQTVMLPRTELELCEHMRDFLVAVDTSIDGDPLVACGALQFYTQHIAEVRSLAVVPERARSGLGKRITEELIEEARRHGVDVVFAFTYVPGFFGKLGFKPVDRGALPLKAWKDCLRCPKFSACDEIAVAYMLTPGAEIYMSAMPPEEAYAEGEILFPILGTPRILDKN